MAHLDLERDLAAVFLVFFGARLVRTRGERRRGRGLRYGWWARRGEDGFAQLGDGLFLASCEPAARCELATVS